MADVLVCAKLRVPSSRAGRVWDEYSSLLPAPYIPGCTPLGDGPLIVRRLRGAPPAVRCPEFPELGAQVALALAVAHRDGRPRCWMFLCAPITHAVGADEDVDFTKTQWALPLCYVTGPWRLVPAHAVVGTVPLLPVLTDFHRLRRLKPAVPSDFRLQPEGAGHATAMQAACLAVEPVFAVTPVV